MNYEIKYQCLVCIGSDPFQGNGLKPILMIFRNIGVPSTGGCTLKIIQIFARRTPRTGTSMIETFVGGIDGHREWMVQVITCDLNGGKRRDYSWFFNTRKEAEDHLAKILENQKTCNLIVKIVKIKAYDFMTIDQF